MSKRPTTQHEKNRPTRKRRLSQDPNQGQLAWTLFVSLVLGVLALFHATSQFNPSKPNLAAPTADTQADFNPMLNARKPAQIPQASP